MKTKTTLIFKNKELQILYDTSLTQQKIKSICFYNGNIRNWTSPKLYTLKEIELFILNKIKKGYSIYSSSTEKNNKAIQTFDEIINSIPNEKLIEDIKLNNIPIIK